MFIVRVIDGFLKKYLLIDDRHLRPDRTAVSSFDRMLPIQIEADAKLSKQIERNKLEVISSFENSHEIVNAHSELIAM